MQGEASAISDPLDVLIIGAGISGIGAGYYLHSQCPQRSYAIVEARDDLGGTWDLFKYPGIRSDSDLFTFGYEFKPWTSDVAIADAAAIKAYLRETATEFGILPKIRFGQRVTDINWVSSERCWHVRVDDRASGMPLLQRARWLFIAAGYYRYDAGYRPSFAGEADFAGPIIHPQQWPSDLNYQGKRVAIIGSGATAVTLVPALAEQAAHVALVQRTPSYILPVPRVDPLARLLRPWLSQPRAHALIRRANIAKQNWVYSFCQHFPRLARRLIRLYTRKMLPEGYPVDVHFNPPYQPWDQRLCAVPDGDLFKVLRSGQASMHTGAVEKFTATGLQLQSGETVDADIIVTATGLNLAPLGSLKPRIDGQSVRFSEHTAFKGMLFSDIPNMATAIGYTSSSWTLKVGLICEHFCRILNYMDEHDLEVCTPRAEPGMETRPLLNFGAGYVQRSMAELPRQGLHFPWTMSWNYAADVKIFKQGRIDDPALQFSPKPAR